MGKTIVLKSGDEFKDKSLFVTETKITKSDIVYTIVRYNSPSDDAIKLMPNDVTNVILEGKDISIHIKDLYDNKINGYDGVNDNYGNANLIRTPLPHYRHREQESINDYSTLGVLFNLGAYDLNYMEAYNNPGYQFLKSQFTNLYYPYYNLLYRPTIYKAFDSSYLRYHNNVIESKRSIGVGNAGGECFNSDWHRNQAFFKQIQKQRAYTAIDVYSNNGIGIDFELHFKYNNTAVINNNYHVIYVDMASSGFVSPGYDHLDNRIKHDIDDKINLLGITF